MRPVRRNASPQATNFTDYKNAKTELISRIGSGWINGNHSASYCSYCERKIDTMLAVEHILPKGGPYAHAYLIGTWSNFLLACPNCNSTKKDKRVLLHKIFLPDRDNTFAAFEYLANGTVKESSILQRRRKIWAKRTLKLVGLDKEMRQTHDEQGRLIAEDRASQRMTTWILAETCKNGYLANPNNHFANDLIISNAIHAGFFSVWMTVFAGIPVMCNRFIDAFAGTRASGCFDPITCIPVSPAPNPDALQNGAKI